MADLSSYCAAVKDLDPDHPHKVYHDREYGFPVTDDNELFGRLILEMNQAGLSWLTILQKKGAFRDAFRQFDIEQVADFDEADRERLLQNSGIIRNRLKINAAIFNARAIQELRAEYGSFQAWLDAAHPRSTQDWVKLFKKKFKFTGGEITKEFLMSTGYLPGAHHPDCPVYQKILDRKPRWFQS